LAANAQQPTVRSENAQGRKLPGIRRHGKEALPHGGFTKGSLERRAMLREQIRQARKLLKDLGG
jgi:hypothetical protein